MIISADKALELMNRLHDMNPQLAYEVLPWMDNFEVYFLVSKLCTMCEWSAEDEVMQKLHYVICHLNYLESTIGLGEDELKKYMQDRFGEWYSKVFGAEETP